jgi:hypothetical protein
MFAPFYLFNKIQTDKRFIIAISRVHPTNCTNHICRGRLHTECNLRSITPTGTDFKKILRNFLPYATSPKRSNDKRLQHLWRNRCFSLILHPIHETNTVNHMVINKLIDLNDEKIMNELDRNSTF